MVSRGLVVGRFQPPHLGHLSLIKHVLESTDEIIIAVAAAQISHTLKNPLTAGERVMMLRSMLDYHDIDPMRYWIIPTQDIMDNALWVSHLKRLLPKFDTFYGNNPFTELLFSEAGVPTKSTPLFSRDQYEASRIRELIIKGEPVKEFLAKPVVDLIKEFKLRERFEGIINDDSQFKDSNTKAGSELQDM